MNIFENLEDDNTMMDLDAIGRVLEVASEYHLQAEVIWSAMNTIKAQPDLSIQDALAHGLLEWDLI